MVSRQRVRPGAETAQELAPLVGQVSAELAGGTEEYRRARAPARRGRSRDVHVRVIGVAGKTRDPRSRVRSPAVELTPGLRTFSISPLERGPAGLGGSHPPGGPSTL